MRKVLLIILGIIAAITALSLLGNIFGLAISAAITYAGLHFYLKATTTFSKIMWALVGIVGLLTAITNIPGFIGLLALAGAYWVYKKWNDHSTTKIFTARKKNDPFTNFEKQWNDIKK